MELQNDIRINRKYKDSSFRFIFHKKENALMLYNAINGSDYQNPDELEIYTMDNFVYMGIKNDLSFLIQDDLNIYEHQSTPNLNMPLRGLLYTSAAMKKYIDKNGLDIYSSKLQELPVPRYYVFYNGDTEIDDEVILRLTDSMPVTSRDQSSVEFTAHIININLGHNTELMKRCPILKEYAIFIDTIRHYQKNGMVLSDAVNRASDECIQNGILADILSSHKAEVTDIMLSEYNEALHIATEKEISYQEGIEHEKKEAAAPLIVFCRDMGLNKEDTLEKLLSVLNMDAPAAQKIIDEYWIE